MAATIRHSFRPSGFFALRTPLLSFEELEAWSAGLAAPASAKDRLEDSLAADRAILTTRLREAWRRPEIREAVFLASPELDHALQSSGDGRAIRGLVAYFSRMTARSTPFGLFAGCSVGTVATETRLALCERASYQRHTRLDMDYLSALVTALEQDEAVRGVLRYRPNTSLYRAGGRLHYAEGRLDKAGRSYHLVAVDDSEYLAMVLEQARYGSTIEKLAASLVSEEITEEEARDFLAELVSSQILVSDLEPPVTGDEAIHALITHLDRHAETRQAACCLQQVRDGLVAIDTSGVGADPERFTAIRRLLEQLPPDLDPSRLFQIDMVKPLAAGTLGGAALAEIVRGLELLARITPPVERSDPLQEFRERFEQRYEGGEVPLVEALDEEVGIGFATSPDPGGEPLLQNLQLPAADPAPAQWRQRDEVLLRLLHEAIRNGREEIALDDATIGELATAEPSALPDALEVMVRLAARSEDQLDRGEFQILLHGAGGGPGARLLGRFCHADPALHRHVAQHLQAEEQLHPDAHFAEIVHLPEGRIGNILARPVLRGYEIPFLGSSGAPEERQIPILDLRVSVRQGRVVLRSAGLDREVIPRLTTAHNVTIGSLGIYRFLHALQDQNTIGYLYWSWGPLASSPYLPRVTAGRLVLSRVQWRMTAAELKPLVEASGPAQYAAVQAWREKRALPRYVALADADNELVLDLDNLLSIESFLHLVKGREEARLVELFPGPEELIARGPEGRFMHEMVIPFVRDVATPSVPATQPASTVRRRFEPGSEWLYARLYGGAAVADQVLLEVVRPVLDEVLARGAVDGWFFIRYSDPDHHIRLRFHGDPAALVSEVLPLLREAAAPLLEDGRIWRLQLDTYVREVERYGGDEGIPVAEKLFRLDSDAILAMIESLPGDEGFEWRWKLALCAIDLLLDDLDFTLEQKHEWARARRLAFAREFRADARLTKQLGEKYRAERGGVEDLLRLAHTPEEPAYPALQALRRRSEAMEGVTAELRRLEDAGRLTASIPDLAASYAHMHINRMLRSAQRFQEYVIYELLDRAYRARIARNEKTLP